MADEFDVGRPKVIMSQLVYIAMFFVFFETFYSDRYKN